MICDFNGEDMVRFIITDNAANMKKAFTASIRASDDVRSEKVTGGMDDEDIWEDCTLEETLACHKGARYLCQLMFVYNEHDTVNC